MIESIQLQCPFCGEPFETTVEPGYGDADYVEDCPVCCQPIRMQMRVAGDGSLESVSPLRDD